MANGFPTAPVGLAYANVTVNALSAAQAAGTAPVIAADPARRALKIVPPTNVSEATLALEAGATSGIPLYGGVSNELVGGECPTNALYVLGLAAGARLVIWKA